MGRSYRGVTSSAWLLVLLVIAGIGRADERRQSAPAARQAVSEAIGAGLQGDSERALSALRAVSAAQFAGADAEFRACMLNRFGRKTPALVTREVKDPWARKVLQAFQSYWWHALKAPSERGTRESELLRSLQKLLGQSAETHDLKSLESLLSAELRNRGYYSQQGVTRPLRELMLWTSQESRNYEVALPEGPRTVNVELLDGFASRGWSYYAVCGRLGAGGWAKRDALYAIRAAYGDLSEQDERFQVSFLVHEAQHFSDYERFPELEPWDLEFRAKLAELSRSRATLGDLLGRFRDNQSELRDSPHAYANRQVLRAVREQLNDEGGDGSVDLSRVTPDDLRRAAQAALFEDTQRRQEGTVHPGRSNP